MKKNLFENLEDLRGKNLCGIYKISIQDHIYIGSSVNIKKRLRRHKTLLRNNKHDNIYMQNAYNKYVKADYEIVEVVDKSISNKDLRNLEASYIKSLKADLNLADPVIGGNGKSKEIYQYTFEGEFVKKWVGAAKASRELNIPAENICSCANPNIKNTKSAGGYLWSYEEKSDLKYTNNTGSNLKRTKVYVYDLNKNFLKEYDSLSDLARALALELNYDKDWKSLRSEIFRVLEKPDTRTLRQKYKVLYNKIE